jgi:hypothetical protein
MVELTPTAMRWLRHGASLKARILQNANVQARRLPSSAWPIASMPTGAQMACRAAKRQDIAAAAPNVSSFTVPSQTRNRAHFVCAWLEKMLLLRCFF